LYRHYLLNDESFTRCESAEAAQDFVAARRAEWLQRLRWKQALDLYARIIEHVADSLATRLPNWRDGLDAETIAMVRSDDQREQLRLQEELLDLRLGERRRLGRAFALMHEKVATSTRTPETTFCPIPDIKKNFVSPHSVRSPAWTARHRPGGAPASTAPRAGQTASTSGAKPSGRETSARASGTPDSGDLSKDSSASSSTKEKGAPTDESRPG
jgi:hypothetical protein